MAEFRMPSLGADMTAGTLVEWLVQPGDVVHRGDIVAVVETEKSTIEVEVFDDGEVEDLLVDPGTKVPVGTALARLRDTGAATVQRDASQPVPAAAAAAAADDGPPVTYSPLVRHLAEERHLPLADLTGSGGGGLLRRADVEAAAAQQTTGRHPGATTPPASVRRNGSRASPRARRLAQQLAIDLSTVPGTGPDGAITSEDVERIAASSRGAGAEQEGAPAEQVLTPTATQPSRPAVAAAADPTSMRHAIARLMARSNREIPHFYLAHDIDMGGALAWLAEENARRSITERLLPAVVLLQAVAAAAAAVPEVNGHWLDGTFVPAPRVDLGVAVSLRTGGLITPVICDAASLGTDAMRVRLEELVRRARSGRFRASDLAEGTVTVTNLGDQGVEVIYGVIHPPQVALVGFGPVRERPWAEHGMVGARPTVTATLAADHRALDGRSGSAFLTAIDHHLQQLEAP